MEQFTLHLQSKPAKSGRIGTLVGVVGSGNLEVLVEKAAGSDAEFSVLTTIKGYQPVWKAVVHDFGERQAIGGLKFSIHDGGASPSVVLLRLLQSLEAYTGDGS